MKLRAALVSLSLFAICWVGTACKESKGGGEAIDCSTPPLEALELPVTWALKDADNEDIAYLTVGGNGEPSILYSPQADPESAVKLHDEFKSIASSDAIGFSWNERGDGIRASCGGEIEKGSPKYAAALRLHIHSVLYMDAKELETIPPGAVPEPPRAL